MHARGKCGAKIPTHRFGSRGRRYFSLTFYRPVRSATGFSIRTRMPPSVIFLENTPFANRKNPFFPMVREQRPSFFHIPIRSSSPGISSQSKPSDLIRAIISRRILGLSSIHDDMRTSRMPLNASCPAFLISERERIASSLKRSSFVRKSVHSMSRRFLCRWRWAICGSLEIASLQNVQTLNSRPREIRKFVRKIPIPPMNIVHPTVPEIEENERKSMPERGFATEWYNQILLHRFRMGAEANVAKIPAIPARSRALSESFLATGVFAMANQRRRICLRAETSRGLWRPSPSRWIFRSSDTGASFGAEKISSVQKSGLTFVWPLPLRSASSANRPTRSRTESETLSEPEISDSESLGSRTAFGSIRSSMGTVCQIFRFETKNGFSNPFSAPR